MKIDIFCAGTSRDDGLITQLGACGVVLVVCDNHNRVQCREFGFDLAGSSQVLSDIQAARLALSSVAPAFRHHETALHLESPYVANLLLSNDESEFLEQTLELRRWYSYYKNISIQVHAAASQRLERAKQLAQDALANQETFDSLTFPE